MVLAPTMPNPPVKATQQQRVTVPFRRATLRRTNMLQTESGTLGNTRIGIERDIPGSGYVTGITLRVKVTTSGNTANVAFNEDAPWNFFDTLALRDVNGELFNLGGFNCYLANLINANYKESWVEDSGDTDLYQLVTGTGATGGSFTFMLQMPIVTNERDYLGLQGNQDRNQRYFLRTDVAPSSAIYSTAPTNAGSFTIEKIYENLAVPLPQDSAGNPQEIFPRHYGTQHFTIATVSENPPAPGVQNHWLKRLGNSIRWVALIFRVNGSRATAHSASNRPTSIQLKIGDNVIYDETYEYRRYVMWKRFGKKFPDGVLVYDNISDFLPFAGVELQDDYYHTRFVNNAQFVISYPSGVGSTNNSLTILTDDLLLVAR